jgi:hypothetical protein
VTDRVLPRPIADAARVLGELRVPWAVAGGWAIDLAVGHATRAHADVDLALFRDDQAALHAALPGWTLRVARGGTLVPWAPGECLEPPLHEVHALPPGDAGAADAPVLEFLLNEREGPDWVHRRDPAVRRPIARVCRRGPGGVRVLAPEVVLLYKSKAPRPADEHDLVAVRPHLDAEARAWLVAALTRHDARHPWIAALARGP